MKLRPHQLEAVELAMQHEGFALFMEQRTGKTLTAIEIVRRRGPDRLLIACPKKAIRVWETALGEANLPQSMETRVVTYNSLWGDRKRLRKWGPEFVIADESHKIQKPRGRHSLGLRYVGRRCRYKLALTGTPMDGKYIHKVWAQYNFIAPEIFGDWSEFRERYLVYGGFKGKKIIGVKNKSEFAQKLRSRFYRVLLEDIQPVKTEIAPPNVVRFDLVESKAAYQSMEHKCIVDLNSGERVVAPRALTVAMKLQQITGGHIIDSDGKRHHVGDEKLAHCGALMLWLGTAPVVVVARFTWEINRIAKLCRALGRTYTIISGQQDFQGFETDVAIVQIQSGIAIDLARAHELIFYSINYSYFDHDQTKFRVLAYDSPYARYHYLVARGTVDEEIFKSQNEKLSLAKLLIDKYRRRK